MCWKSDINFGIFLFLLVYTYCIQKELSFLPFSKIKTDSKTVFW